MVIFPFFSHLSLDSLYNLGDVLFQEKIATRVHRYWISARNQPPAIRARTQLSKLVYLSSTSSYPRSLVHSSVSASCGLIFQVHWIAFVFFCSSYYPGSRLVFRQVRFSAVFIWVPNEQHVIGTIDIQKIVTHILLLLY